MGMQQVTGCSKQTTQKGKYMDEVGETRAFHMDFSIFETCPRNLLVSAPWTQPGC